jgi:ribonuclease P protein component
LIWRIRGKRAFDELARRGRSSRGKVLWCRFLNDPDASPLRVGFSVGRSYGRATERNRLRRRLRVLVDQEAAACGLTAGWLLVGARPSAHELTFDELQADLRAQLQPLANSLAASPDGTP